MKKLLLLAVMGVIIVGCQTSEKKANESSSTQYAKHQIIDQEFDNLTVPNDSYDKVTPYEEQVNGASYIQSSTTSTRKKGTKKPARQMASQKVVVDGKGNVLSSRTSAPITDEEALPEF